MHNNKASAGLSLTELLIALAVIGAISAFTVPYLLQSNRHSLEVTKAQRTTEILTNAYGLANGAMGLAPIKTGTGVVLQQYLKAGKFDTPSDSQIPAEGKALTVQGIAVIQPGDS